MSVKGKEHAVMPTVDKNRPLMGPFDISGVLPALLLARDNSQSDEHPNHPSKDLRSISLQSTPIRSMLREPRTAEAREAQDKRLSLPRMALNTVKYIRLAANKYHSTNRYLRMPDSQVFTVVNYKLNRPEQQSEFVLDEMHQEPKHSTVSIIRSSTPHE